MFNNVAIDVSLGLVFIFLIYSLLATIVQELIAQVLNLRAFQLHDAIGRMLTDSTEPQGTGHLISLHEAFYRYPLIKYLATNSGCRFPSYITPDNFSQTLMHLLRGDSFNQTIPQMELIQHTLFPKMAAGNNADIKAADLASLEAPFKTKWWRFGKGNKAASTRARAHLTNILSRQQTYTPDTRSGHFFIAPETLQYLRALWVESGNDSNKFKSKLESWFQDTMDRASGWYKRKTQCMLFIIGIGLAAAFNVDTITITDILSHDKSARAGMVSIAVQNKDNYNPEALKNPNNPIVKATNALDSDQQYAKTLIGLGWKPSLAKQEYQVWYLVPFGWLITALAISLGAPFWFDLLNKIIQLRGTGPKPDDTPAKQTPGTAKPVVDPQNRKG